MIQGSVKLVVSLENGQVKVEGPITDKFLCYALLEGARDAIKDYNDHALKSGIIPAQQLPTLRKVE
jgi:hypothetical protein